MVALSGRVAVGDGQVDVCTDDCETNCDDAEKAEGGFPTDFWRHVDDAEDEGGCDDHRGSDRQLVVVRFRELVGEPGSCEHDQHSSDEENSPARELEILLSHIAALVPEDCESQRVRVHAEEQYDQKRSNYTIHE